MNSAFQDYLRVCGLRNQLELPGEIEVEYYKTGCGQYVMQCPLCCQSFQTENITDIKFHLLSDHLQIYTVNFIQQDRREAASKASWTILPGLQGTSYTDESILVKIVKENKAYFGRNLRLESVDKEEKLAFPCLSVPVWGRLTHHLCIFCCFSTTEQSTLMQHLAEAHVILRMKKNETRYQPLLANWFSGGFADAIPELSEVLSNEVVDALECFDI